MRHNILLYLANCQRHKTIRKKSAQDWHDDEKVQESIEKLVRRLHRLMPSQKKCVNKYMRELNVPGADKYSTAFSKDFNGSSTVPVCCLQMRGK